MARKEQTDGGAWRSGRSRRSRSSRRSSERKSRGGGNRKASSRRAAHATQASQATQATQTAARPQVGSVWNGSAGAAGGPAQLLALVADQPQPAALLTLAGAERETLREAFQAWGAASDQAANRVWRRPGGMTRMAGV